MSDEAHEATPDHELERQIMSYNEAKNEREWWAMHEIERLREELYEIKLAAAGGEDVPGAANMVTANDVEKWVTKYCEEIERLREALRDCHHVLHKLMAIVPGNDTAVDEMAKVMTKARAALGEGKE